MIILKKSIFQLNLQMYPVVSKQMPTNIYKYLKAVCHKIWRKLAIYKHNFIFLQMYPDVSAMLLFDFLIAKYGSN